MNTPTEIMDDSYRYIIWVFGGLFATALYNMLSGAMRALGDSRRPLLFLIVACIVNIVLDFALIQGLGMGTAGAGLATVIAQLVSGLLCVGYIYKKMPALHFTWIDLKPDKAILKQLRHLGAPMALLGGVISLGSVMLQSVNNGFGAVYITAYTAASKIFSFVSLPINSIGAAISVFVAQNYGADKPKRIIRGVNKSMLIGCIWCVASAMVILVFGRSIMRAVAGGESAEVIENGYLYLVVSSALALLLVPLIIYKAALQALGYAVVPVLSGIAEVFARGGISVVLSASFGFMGFCFVNPSAWLAALVPIFINYMFVLKKLKNGIS